MRKVVKAFAILSLTGILAITPAASLYAAEYEGPEGDLGELTDDQEEYGHTTLSILYAKQNPNNVSFEVPLYVTMAATGGKTSITMPTNYSIKNTSAKYVEGNDDIAAYDIAVVGINFTKLKGATYATVESAGTTAYEMLFSIGGVIMPAINIESGEVSLDADMKANTSVFYSNNQFKAIPASGDVELNIPLSATLGTAPYFDGNNTPVAQFKVCYTVGAMNASGDVLGSVYAGDNKDAAGL